MIQQVNLYTDELKPRREPLQAGTLLAAVAAVLVLILVMAVFVRVEAADQEERLESLNDRIEQMEQGVGRLTAEVEAQQVDPDMVRAVDQISQDIAQRQRLLAQVSRLVSPDRRGFSSYLTALARQAPEQVWLTGFMVDLSGNRIRISGRTLAGDQVPVYLEQLGQEAVFSGRRFERLNLQRDESGRWINFEIASERAPGGGQ